MYMKKTNNKSKFKIKNAGGKYYEQNMVNHRN